MKKLLLSMVTLAITASVSMANVTKFVFDGDNDMGDLKRQTDFDAKKIDPASLDVTDSFSYSQDGVDFSIKKEGDKGLGFALVNGGQPNAGLLIYATIFGEYMTVTPEITLSVPNGKINGFKLVMSGSALTTFGLPVNGTEIEPESENDCSSWTWSNAEGVESVTFGWENKWYARYIHSIEVTYTPDLGDKKECGLSFDESVAEVIMGKDSAFPVLSNPNNLPIVWKSSNENVATVSATGEVTLVGGGQTVITAATEGNDSYAAGNVKYELNVIAQATSLLQMLKLAPSVHDKVYVNFPMTVTYANLGYAFVIDSEGTAGYIQNIKNQGSTSSSVVTIYKVGDIIPAGWIATNSTIYSSLLWEGIPENVTETTEVTYPYVDSVTPEDANRVVILRNVTFASATASGNTKAYGTTPDGTRYEFQDNYNVASQPAGTYDVTCIVRYSLVGSTEYFYLAPIAYQEASQSGVSEIDTLEGEARYFNLQGVEVTQPENGIYIKILNGNVTKVIK